MEVSNRGKIMIDSKLCNDILGIRVKAVSLEQLCSAVLVLCYILAASNSFVLLFGQNARPRNPTSSVRTREKYNFPGQKKSH